jgi:hypothetical protein
MNPTSEDYAVFEEMKKSFLESGLSINDEGREENYLFFASGLFAEEVGKGGRLFCVDLIIAYELRVKAIRIESEFPMSTPSGKNSDILELFNDINPNLVNSRLYINPKTQAIVLRGDMGLFGR